MTPTEILEAITAAGGELRCTDDGVSIIAPEPLDPELLAQVRSQKAEFLLLLQAEETAETVLTQAMTWLSTALAHGPQPEGKLALEAQAAGITKATLRRAKTALGVKSKRQGKHWVWASPQGAQGAQDAQGAHRQQANPKTITGADGRPCIVRIAQCPRCSGSNWGPSGRHTPDEAEIWSCLDCARPSPETPPTPRASDRDEYACPACGPYTIVRDARSTICFRCHRRF
jgi:hypothetical protein